MTPSPTGGIIAVRQRNGPVDKFDVQRQIADVATQHYRRTLIERRAVEAYGTLKRRSDTDRGVRKRRLASALGTTMPSAVLAASVNEIPETDSRVGTRR